MKFLLQMLLKIKFSNFFVLIFVIYTASSCSNIKNEKDDGQLNPNEITIKDGNWLGKLIIDSANFIPFNFSVLNDQVTISNDKEKIITQLVQQGHNQYQIDMPVFNSILSFYLKEDSLIGHWHNYAKSKDYKMPFLATFKDSDLSRFEFKDPPSSSFEGEWEVTFGDIDSTNYQAIGVFKQNGKKLTGTFITETGDYRFLDGAVKNDSLYLSCFDGSHAFLFKAGLNNNKLSGIFYSGNHFKEQWEAVKNVNFKLKNPDSITTISALDEIVFTFPNLDSNIINYPSKEFNNKVVIIQIIGSWCPNCMDETVFLSDLYDQYNKDGLEIICLAFEKPNSFKEKCKNLSKLIKHADAKYQFLIAGESSKKEVEKTLPFIKNVTSFPTCIILDKKGMVQKVHSGFYGPGTGKYYEEYTKEINELVKTLLVENINI